MGDQQLEVTVLPVSGSFFAGEKLTVHITLTNTSQPLSSKPMASPLTAPLGLHQRAHKSALSLESPASAISSNQGSPAPRTPLSASFAALQKENTGHTLPQRKGIVGKNAQIIAASSSARNQQQTRGHSGRVQSQHKKQNYSMAWSSTSDLTDLSAQHAAAGHLAQQTQNTQGSSQSLGKRSQFFLTVDTLHRSQCIQSC